MKNDVNQYQIEWSYVREDNKRIYECDVFLRCSAADAVKDIRLEYQDCVDLCIEDVWKDSGHSWDHVDRELWDR